MCIEVARGRVVIDLSRCGSRELSETYQAFGMLCARRKVRAALLKASGEPVDAHAHYALRDVLVTVGRVAGVPLRFKLALVAGSEALERTYRALQPELRSLGCEYRVFRTERDAVRWLGSGKRTAQAAAVEAAALS